MTSLIVFIWLLDVVVFLKVAASFFLGVAGMAWFFGLTGSVAPYPMRGMIDWLNRRWVISIVMPVIAVLLLVFVPSRETLMMMGGVYYGSEAIKAAADSPIVKKSLVLLEREIDEMLEEKKEQKK